MAEDRTGTASPPPASGGLAGPPSAPLHGRFGRYEIVKLLGRGGMGAVYLARQIDLDRACVVKVIAPELAQDPLTVERLHREARAAAKISSDNVVQVYETGVEGGIPFIAMEYVDGTSACEYLKAKGKRPPAEATKVVLAAARGLRAAHEVGILHRDIKPANLLITKDGRVKVADFGLAKFQPGAPAASATSGPASTLSVQGMILGTPDYMAPEQAEGQDLDPRADVWALGVTYYELLTGKRPFVGETVLKTLSLVLTADPAPPSTLTPDLPPEVERACLQMLAKEREGRPASALATIALLEAALRAAQRPSSARVGRARSTVAAAPAPPVAAPPAGTAPAANRGAMAVVAAGGAVLVLALIVGVSIVRSHARRAAALAAPPSEQPTASPSPAATLTPPRAPEPSASSSPAPSAIAEPSEAPSAAPSLPPWKGPEPSKTKDPAAPAPSHPLRPSDSPRSPSPGGPPPAGDRPEAGWRFWKKLAQEAAELRRFEAEVKKEAASAIGQEKEAFDDLLEVLHLLHAPDREARLRAFGELQKLRERYPTSRAMRLVVEKVEKMKREGDVPGPKGRG